MDAENNNAAKAGIELSVVVPVHNVEPYLKRCVRSLLPLLATGRAELILVENGSTDGSLALARSLAAGPAADSIRVLVSEAVGASEARNCGVEAARGRWIGFVDADDYVDPQMFQSLLDAATSSKADCAYCNLWLLRDDKREAVPSHYTGETFPESVADAVAKVLCGDVTSGPIVRILHRDFLLRNRFPEGVFYEDHATTYLWLSQQKSIVHVDRPLYFYEIRPGSTTTTTASSPRKISDYFTADLDRISFIREYSPLTRAQRRRAYEVTVRNLLRHLRDYIRTGVATSPDDEALLALRSRLLNGLKCIPAGALKPGTRLRLLRVRFGWRGYFRHYARRGVEQ